MRRGDELCLTVTTELERVALADGGVLAAALGLVVAVALALATAPLAGGGEATALAALVNGLGDPVDARVAADGLVLRVNGDDLKVLVHTVLVDPVRVEDAQVRALAAHTLLGGGTQRALVLEVVDTLAHGLAVGGTLGHGLLAVTTAHTDAVDNVTLLGLVAETVRLVETRRARGTVDHVELAVLPASIESNRREWRWSVRTNGWRR